MINKLITMQDNFTEKQRKNVVQFLKLDDIPLDLRVATGKDLYKSAMKTMKNKEAPTMSKKNAKMLLSAFETPKLAKAILGRML